MVEFKGELPLSESGGVPMLMVRHDFHWLSDGEHEVPTVRSLGVRLSKLSVAGEGEDGELAEGEIAAAS